jgi:hypothetical protein
MAAKCVRDFQHHKQNKEKKKMQRTSPRRVPYKALRMYLHRYPDSISPLAMYAIYQCEIPYNQLHLQCEPLL